MVLIMVAIHKPALLMDDFVRYVAEPIGIGQPYYTDRAYIINTLPNFLKGLYGVKTANSDSGANPNDKNWLCFEINTRAAIYVLFDKRATDHPTWLKDGFEDQDISTVAHTDTNMGYFELFYSIRDPGKVCLGGPGAPGVGSNYLVLAGPMVDLRQHASHQVEITNLVVHSQNSYQIATLNSGDKYNTDRNSVLGELPMFLQNLNGVRNSENDCELHRLVELVALPPFQPEGCSLVAGFKGFAARAQVRIQSPATTAGCASLWRRKCGFSSYMIFASLIHQSG
jgi:hypothetical protein